MMRSSISDAGPSWGALSQQRGDDLRRQVVGRIEASDPLWARPIGLRAVATMTASGMASTIPRDTPGDRRSYTAAMPLGAQVDEDGTDPPTCPKPWRPSWARHAALASSVVVGACLLAVVGTSSPAEVSSDRLRSSDPPAAWPRRPRWRRRQHAGRRSVTGCDRGTRGSGGHHDDRDPPGGARPAGHDRAGTAPRRRARRRPPGALGGTEHPSPAGPPPPWAWSIRTTAAGYVDTDVGCARRHVGRRPRRLLRRPDRPGDGHDYQHVYPLGGDR